MNIRPIYLPSSALHGPHCLNCDFTWLAKPALEKQTTQLSPSMQQCMGSVPVWLAISWGNKMQLVKYHIIISQFLQIQSHFKDQWPTVYSYAVYSVVCVMVHPTNIAVIVWLLNLSWKQGKSTACKSASNQWSYNCTIPEKISRVYCTKESVNHVKSRISDRSRHLWSQQRGRL